jgi:hypothetical protein
MIPLGASFSPPLRIKEYTFWPEFQHAFGLKEGGPTVRPEALRVSIW